MNFKVFWLIQLFSPAILVSCRDSSVIDMIVSFLTFDTRPTVLLTPYLCWSPYYIRTLARSLSDNSVSLALSDQSHLADKNLQYVVLLADLACPGAYGYLVNASIRGFFKSPFRWLILQPNKNYEKISFLMNIDAFLDSEVVVATRMSEREFELTEVYKISENSREIRSLRGYWKGMNKHAKYYLDLNRKAPKIIQLSKEMKIAEPKARFEEFNNKKDVLSFGATIGKTKKEEMVIETTNQDLNLKNVKEVKVTKYGVIEDYRDNKFISSKRRNLEKHTLTMANVITDSNDTRNHLVDRLDLRQDSITKMSATVVGICFDMLNATEKHIFTTTWGYQDKNGQWQKGVVRHLLDKEADLGTLLIFTKERMEVVDYIAMVGSTAVRFVFREPPLSYVSNIFALPFTGAVWLAILICVLGCSLFLYVTSKWESSLGMHPLQLDGSWADVLILIIGAVLQQGCTLEPRYAAGRIVTLFVFLSLTILYAAYSANIVVLLRAPSSSVRTLPDLLRSPLTLGASDFEYNRYFFKKLNDPIRKAIYTKKIAPKGKKPNFYSMKDGIEKIRQGLFAFHMEINPGYRLIQDTYKEDEKCDLVEIDFINEIDPWVPGQKRSPFKELFKISFLKIRESGVQSCMHRRLHVPRPHCSGTIATFSSVGIGDIYPALLVTLYGFLVAPTLLLLEISYQRILQCRHNKSDRHRIKFTH